MISIHYFKLFFFFCTCPLMHMHLEVFRQMNLCIPISAVQRNRSRSEKIGICIICSKSPSLKFAKWKTILNHTNIDMQLIKNVLSADIAEFLFRIIRILIFLIIAIITAEKLFPTIQHSIKQGINMLLRRNCIQTMPRLLSYGNGSHIKLSLHAGMLIECHNEFNI